MNSYWRNNPFLLHAPYSLKGNGTRTTKLTPLTLRRIRNGNHKPFMPASRRIISLDDAAPKFDASNNMKRIHSIMLSGNAVISNNGGGSIRTMKSGDGSNCPTGVGRVNSVRTTRRPRMKASVTSKPMESYWQNSFHKQQYWQRLQNQFTRLASRLVYEPLSKAYTI